MKKVCLNIKGMHCASCEVLIERKFKDVPGIADVRVHHATGKAEITSDGEPDIAALNRAVAEHGYTVSKDGERNDNDDDKPQKGGHLETGAIFLVLLGLYLMGKQLDLLPDVGIRDSMGYGVVFLIGLVAAFSTCIAVTGGLLVAVAAKYNERFPHLTGAQKFRPHLYFNMGRVVGYMVFGGLVGALGSIIALSPRMTGWLTIGVSIVMIMLGFDLLKLFPWLKRFYPRMPKFIAHRVHAMSGSDSRGAPFTLGAATFFLPCGFTQALQLYVLSQGDPVQGALIMGVFALGTLPALLSLSAISSFAKGGFQRYFLKFAGALVVMLGIFNVNNGLNLTGNPFRDLFTPSQASVVEAAGDPNVRYEDGKQVVDMRVVGLSYSPARFTVVQGIPVEWRIDGRRAQGCSRVITAPRLGITSYLASDRVTPITFTPQQTGTFAFSCTMGMTTRGAAFVVVPNPDSNTVTAAGVSSSAGGKSAGCDPKVMNCALAQKLFMEVSRERGFYPNSFTVKRGLPVELEVDVQLALGGCMGTLVLPDYNVAQRLTLGKNTITFTPTKPGVVPFTCAMGSKLGEIVVN